MCPVLPAHPFEIDQAQIRFVHQRRGLERVVFALATHVPTRQSVQLRVNERHQLIES